MPGVAKVSGPRDCQVRVRRQVEEQEMSQEQEECYEEGVNYAGHGIPDNRVESVASPGACQEACLLRLGCQVRLSLVRSFLDTLIIGQHWTWNTPASARFPSTCWLKSRTALEGRREGAEHKVRHIDMSSLTN